MIYIYWSPLTLDRRDSDFTWKQSLTRVVSISLLSLLLASFEVLSFGIGISKRRGIPSGGFLLVLFLVSKYFHTSVALVLNSARLSCSSNLILPPLAAQLATCNFTTPVNVNQYDQSLITDLSRFLYTHIGTI